MDPAPFATVVTDLTTCHNTWFYRGVDRCFVPTETCRRRALRMGLRADQARASACPAVRRVVPLPCSLPVSARSGRPCSRLPVGGLQGRHPHGNPGLSGLQAGAAARPGYAQAQQAEQSRARR